MACLICKNLQTSFVQAVDIQTKEKFDYVKCSSCDVMYLNIIPDNYSKYYSTNYYSFKSKRGLIAKFKFLRDAFAFSKKGILGRLVFLFQPNNNIASLRLLNIKKDQSLLDIGCGDGKEIKVLQQLGYSKVQGIDPFIEKNIEFNGKVLVKKIDLSEVEGLFDYLTMHHSFEHVANPFEVLSQLKSILKKDGKILIRIPVANSVAYKIYEKNWVQFDAPRHIFLHTTKSLGYMCNELNLQIKKVIYDSTSFQFWGSELVKNGTPIHLATNKQIFFSRIKSLLFGYGIKAMQLNKEKQGDQAVYLITLAQ